MHWMMFNFTTSIMFMISKHPLSLNILLIIQTILISLLIIFKMNLQWYAYSLFLIMISGMLIMFMYMSSVSSNWKFSFSWNKFMMVMIMICMIYPMKINFLNINFLFSISKFFNFPSNMILLMIIIMLLIMMIIIIKLTKINFGSLRQSYEKKLN